MIPSDYHLQTITTVVCISGFLLIFSRFFPNEEVISSRELKALKDAMAAVEDAGERKVICNAYFVWG